MIWFHLILLVSWLGYNISPTTTQPQPIIYSSPANDPQNIHLSYTGDPQSMFVTWMTLKNFQDPHVVYYDMTDSQKTGLPNEILYVLAATTSLVHEGPDRTLFRTTFIHRATLKNLHPHTIYVYRACGDGVCSKDLVFKTFRSDQSITVALYGDMSSRQFAAVESLIRETENYNVDMAIHLGDIGYNLDSDYGMIGDTFLNIIQPFASRIPINFVAGNHEEYNNFTEFVGRFTSPSPSVHYNSFNVGFIHFIVINVEFYHFDNYGVDQIQSQYNWLVNDLEKAEKNRKEQPWVVALMHKPMYCSNGVDDDCSLVESVTRIGYKHHLYPLEQLFETYKVDLVLAGHMHVYERTYPLFNYSYYYDKNILFSHYHDAQYPVHITSGSAGGLEVQKFADEQPGWSAVRSEVPGYLTIKTISKYELEVKQSDLNEGLIDNLRITKSEYSTSPMPPIKPNVCFILVITVLKEIEKLFGL